MKNINWVFPSVRNLPDVTAEDFSKVDLRQFKWVHWEVSGGPGTSNHLHHCDPVVGIVVCCDSRAETPTSR